MANYFKNLIGQEGVKETLSIYLEAYHKGNRAFPHVLAVAPKGVGKTMFCQKTADYLGKPIKELNAGDMKSPKLVAQNLFAPMQGKKMTVFIDEVHAIPNKAVQNMMLSVLNPTKTHRNEVTIDDITYQFDFQNLHTFLFATTEPQLVFEPLRDRMEEIAFDDYTNFELSYILAQNCEGIKLCDDTLEKLADFSRGNARWAAKAGEKIVKYCIAKDLNEFTMDDVEPFAKSLGIYTFGLTKQEVNLLKLLLEYPQGVTITALASRSGNTMPAQRNIEKYLQKHNLIEVDGKRKITQKGIELLRSL